MALNGAEPAGEVAMGGNEVRGDRGGLFYAARFFFGGWFLFHGLNYWLHYFPEPSFAPGAHGFIPELVRIHVFDVVKVLEVVIGAALLLDLFAPLAIVAAVPITLVIAQVNLLKATPFGLFVGIAILLLNAIMAIGHLDRYLPMLAMRGGRPGTRGLVAALGRPIPAAPDRRRLPPRVHLAAALLGIAVPAALTYASIYFPVNPRTPPGVRPAPPR